MLRSRRQLCKLLVNTLAFAALPISTQRRAAADNGTPRFRILETYSRTLVWTGRGRKRVYDTVESGQFRLNIRIPMTGTDISAFGPTTHVLVEIHDRVFDVALSDDPSYTAGKSRANVILTAVGPKGDAVTYLKTALKWDAREMHIRIDAVTPTRVEPLFGWDFLDRLTGRYFESTEARVSVADLVIQFEIDLSGRTVSRSVTRNDEVFELSSTSITGKIFTDDWKD